MRGQQEDYINMFYSSLNKGVDIYLSPPSGRITTMFLPSYSFLCAISRAALKAAPEEIPTSIPSL